MTDAVISSLRGKVLEKPARKQSHLSQGDVTEDWTPYNSSLHMQSIKVRVNNPSIPQVKKDDAFEDTMFLIDLVRQQKQKENKEKKEEMIFRMAMEAKKKKNEGKGKYVNNYVQ